MVSDTDVQQLIYRTTVEQGRPPRSTDVAARLGIDAAAAIDAFKRLNSRRLLALAPESGEIVMAPPFSAVPTPFVVTAGWQSYFANCVWDSFGIAAALHQDTDVETSCACCGEAMTLRVRGGSPEPTPGIAHFAVPAAHWWDDITYT
ncbi:MAG TPA: organomercurial lyase [Thermoanaerobaculia bacterium]|nr:organomercurial lyase [Thermoanaerobaculia bacterium]